MTSKPETKNDLFDVALENELAPYVQHFNLHSLPFTTEIPDQNYYSNAEREQHLNHLTHLLQSSDLVLVLSGESGSGKSTLIQQLLKRNTPGLDFCQVTANEQLDPASLLTQLTRCFELPEQLDIEMTLDLLKDHANILRTNNRVPVAIIDDAHELPAESLKILMSLQSVNEQAHQDHWHIILVTHPAFSNDLLSLSDHLHFIHLKPLESDQIRAYLEYRLKMAGFEGELPFSAKDLDFICQQSEGLPARIHQLAHQVMMQKKPAIPAAEPLQQEQEIPNQRHWNRGIIAGTLFIILLLGTVLVFQDKINRFFEHDSPRGTTDTHESLPLPVNDKPTYLLRRIPDPVSRVRITSPKTPPHPATSEPAPETKPVVETAKKTTPKRVKKPVTAVDTTKTVTPPVTRKPAPASAFEQKLRQNGIFTRSWILQQPASHFTAQIMASTRVDNLIQQTRLPAMKGKSAIYRIQRNGKPWYVLLFGHKSGRLAIKAALAGLPDHLQKNRPWIRSFSAIQAEIRAGRK